jgi:hypothetical protein
MDATQLRSTPHGVSGPLASTEPEPGSEAHFQTVKADWEGKVKTDGPRFIAKALTNPGDVYPKTLSKADGVSVEVNSADDEAKARKDGYLAEFPGLSHSSSDAAEMVAWISDRFAEGKFSRFSLYDSLRSNSQGARMIVDAKHFKKADIEAFAGEATVTDQARMLYRASLRPADPIAISDKKADAPQSEFPKVMSGDGLTDTVAANAKEEADARAQGYTKAVHISKA